MTGLTGLLLVSALVLLASGCAKTADVAQKPAEFSPAPEIAVDAGHNLDGWWCSEHGLPEEECSMCSTEAADKLKAKGDWCQQHDRADSQCFVCHPELESKFAARYEAKFGKKPPKPTE
jgi:hypothetical protein